MPQFGRRFKTVAGRRASLVALAVRRAKVGGCLISCQIVRGLSPGRYDVEEIGAEPFPSGLWREARKRAWWSLVCGGKVRTTVAQAEKPGRVALPSRTS